MKFSKTTITADNAIYGRFDAFRNKYLSVSIGKDYLDFSFFDNMTRTKTIGRIRFFHAAKESCCFTNYEYRSTDDGGFTGKIMEDNFDFTKDNPFLLICTYGTYGTVLMQGQCFKNGHPTDRHVITEIHFNKLEINGSDGPEMD